MKFKKGDVVFLANATEEQLEQILEWFKESGYPKTLYGKDLFLGIDTDNDLTYFPTYFFYGDAITIYTIAELFPKTADVPEEIITLYQTPDGINFDDLEHAKDHLKELNQYSEILDVFQKHFGETMLRNPSTDLFIDELIATYNLTKK